MKGVHLVIVNDSQFAELKNDEDFRETPLSTIELMELEKTRELLRMAVLIESLENQ